MPTSIGTSGGNTLCLLQARVSFITCSVVAFPGTTRVLQRDAIYRILAIDCFHR
jgi:hypothetical protein